MDFAGLGGSRNVEALMDKLGLDTPEREAFGCALLKGNAGRAAVVRTPLAPPGWIPDFAEKNIAGLEWLPEGVFPVQCGIRPGREKGYGEGWFYSLDLSSVWESAALSVCDAPVKRFLDMCAAPGGKSILCSRRLFPEIHFANEIDPGRLGILRHNLRRCGITREVYTQKLSPRVWAEKAPRSFDLMWVDAPCSGQSLLAKGIANPGCFFPGTVKGNAKRQKGILAASADCLAAGGIMGYSTCSFSLEENELMVDWFLKKFPGFATVEVPALLPWLSKVGSQFCYRLMPQHGLGAGGFVTLLRKPGELPQELPGLDAELHGFPVQPDQAEARLL